MVVTAVWTAMLLSVSGWEVRCRLRQDRWASLLDVVVATSQRRIGLLLLIGCWMFVGIHLFARYTAPT